MSDTGVGVFTKRISETPMGLPALTTLERSRYWMDPEALFEKKSRESSM